LPRKDRESYNQYMREYRARKKFRAKAEEIEAFIKAFGPFKSDFEKMLDAILNSDDPLQMIQSLLRDKWELHGQLTKEFYESMENHAVLQKTDPIESAKLWIHIEGIQRKIELTSMEIVTLKFASKLLMPSKIEVTE